MKSTIFRKVLSEEYIEVKKSVTDTIKFLSEIRSGTSHGDADVYLHCSKKGKIKLGYCFPSKSHRHPENMYPLYEVRGRVIEKDNKTYIKKQSVYKVGNVYLQYVLVLLATLIIPPYFLMRISVDKFNIYVFGFGVFFCLLGILISTLFYISKQKKRGLELIPAMEEKLKKSIETIEKWD